MKKVCVVTAARSEYGLLRWLLKELQSSSSLQLQLLVTGSHLSPEYGLTYREIEDDGFQIDKKIEFLLSSSTATGIVKSMGLCSISISDALSDLSPDLMVVLGDRYELLPICSAALVMRIPIAHISGGDITEGAIDDKVRNAITMMADYHFPGTGESALRIQRMSGSESNIFVTGETNLDNFLLLPRLSRQELSNSLKIDESKRWILCTYHSETTLSLEENMERVNCLVKLFTEEYIDYEIIISKSNADYGGTEINSLWQKVVATNNHIHLFDSLGQKKYISILYQVVFMIGNSSSGIFESPVVGVPVVNIGERQRGRLLTSNIISACGTYSDILDSSKAAIEFYNKGIAPIDNPYGDGKSSKRIVEILTTKLLQY